MSGIVGSINFEFDEKVLGLIEHRNRETTEFIRNKVDCAQLVFEHKKCWVTELIQR